MSARRRLEQRLRTAGEAYLVPAPRGRQALVRRNLLGDLVCVDTFDGSTIHEAERDGVLTVDRAHVVLDRVQNLPADRNRGPRNVTKHDVWAHRLTAAAWPREATP